MTIVLFNMSGFAPTVESENKFKEWSSTMKNINFGLVDVKTAGGVTFKDASGKEGKHQ